MSSSSSSGAGPPPKLRENLRFRWFDQFYQYRTGKRRDFARLPIPLLGDVPEIVMPGTKQVALPYSRKPNEKEAIDQYENEQFVDPKNKKAFKGLQILKSNFSLDLPTCKYQKCLGWGGNGLAAKFDVVDKNGAKKKSVVVKMIFQDDEGVLAQEVDSLKAGSTSRIVVVFKKAEHIIQLLYVDGEGVIRTDDPGKKDSDGDSPMKDADDDDSPPDSKPKMNTFIMEMLEGGDLSELIAKVRQRDENFPVGILWRLTLCFVRMAIALGYPPNSLKENAGRREGPIRETVPERLKDEPLRWCHFDFDPKNIFIGDIIGDGEHGAAPIAKLGDFGLATEVKLDKHDFYYELLRIRGKQYFFAPEQFCIDWEYIERDKDLIREHPLAGNFGAHTNVWAVGLLIETLITKCWPAHPPRPTRTEIMVPEGKEWYYTYGAHLDQEMYRYVPRELVYLVFRCLAHLPEDRPTLFDLEKYVTNAIRNLEGESERELLSWIQEVLYDPLPEPPSEGIQDVWIRGGLPIVPMSPFRGGRRTPPPMRDVRPPTPSPPPQQIRGLAAPQQRGRRTLFGAQQAGAAGNPQPIRPARRPAVIDPFAQLGNPDKNRLVILRDTTSDPVRPYGGWFGIDGMRLMVSK
ncbi:kinase-like domain-containing protein [Nemania abortiva]|nr:kinase-like domain-containing protein [Nemania abortiva]